MLQAVVLTAAAAADTIGLPPVALAARATLPVQEPAVAVGTTVLGCIPVDVAVAATGLAAVVAAVAVDMAAVAAAQTAAVAAAQTADSAVAVCTAVAAALAAASAVAAHMASSAAAAAAASDTIGLPSVALAARAALPAQGPSAAAVAVRTAVFVAVAVAFAQTDPFAAAQTGSFEKRLSPWFVSVRAETAASQVDPQRPSSRWAGPQSRVSLVATHEAALEAVTQLVSEAAHLPLDVEPAASRGRGPDENAAALAWPARASEAAALSARPARQVAALELVRTAA